MFGSDKIRNLDDLFHHELKDLYSAESQLEKALPRMAEQAKDPQLRMAFETHLQETRMQRQRLEQIGKNLNLDLDGHTCKAMAGLIAEGESMMSEDASPEAMDAGLVACAQRVEHYEISGYGTARHYAERLGHTEAARVLEQSLSEEQNTDTKLNNLAKSWINVKAMHR